MPKTCSPGSIRATRRQIRRRLLPLDHGVAKAKKILASCDQAAAGAAAADGKQNKKNSNGNKEEMGTSMKVSLYEAMKCLNFILLSFFRCLSAAH